MKQLVALAFGLMILAVPAAAQQRMQHPMGPGPGAGPGMGMHMGMGPGMGGCGCGMDGMGHFMMGMGTGMMPMLMQNADELKLTDEQIGKLHRIHMKHVAADQEMMKASHETKGNVMEALENPAADEAAIRAAGKAHTDAMSKMLDAAIAERNEMMAVLTADQKAKLKTLKPAASPEK